MTQQQLPAGWYQDPQSPPGVMRYWDGNQWTPHLQGGMSSPGQDRQTRALIGFGLFALAAVGAAIALFTNVSLLTGTGTVWTGTAIALVAAVGARDIPAQDRARGPNRMRRPRAGRARWRDLRRASTAGQA
jgi:hypothetical protein